IAGLRIEMRSGACRANAFPVVKPLEHGSRSAELAGNVNAIACLRARAQHGSSRRNLADDHDVCRYVPGAGDVTSRKLDLEASSQPRKAMKEFIHPRLGQPGRQPQGEKACNRFAPHCGDVAKAARQAAMSDTLRRMPLSTKVYVFNVEVGGC